MTINIWCTSLASYTYIFFMYVSYILFFIPKVVLQTAFKSQHLRHLSEPLYISLCYFKGAPSVYECATGYLVKLLFY